MKILLLSFWLWLKEKSKPVLQPIGNWLNDLLVPRELAYINYIYYSQYKHQNPVVSTHILLARVRRTASMKELTEAFDKEAPALTKFTIKDIKILPITKLPRI